MKIPGMNVTEKHENYSLWAQPLEDGFPTFHKCTRCGGTRILCPTKFCPDCGAYMVNWPEAKAEYDAYSNPMPETETETNEGEENA